MRLDQIMRRVPFRLLAVAALLVPASVSAQPFESEHLADPGLLISYVQETAAFWLPAYDQSRGGFYTNVARNGSVNTSAGASSAGGSKSSTRMPMSSRP